MNVKDIMTRNIISVKTDASILEAIRLMIQHGISGVVVVDKKGDLAGIVTEGDFLRRSEIGTERRRSSFLRFLAGPGKLAEEYVHNSGRKIDEVMSREVHTVAEDTSLAEAIDMMERYRVKRLPVVRGARVVGIVSRANFLHAFASVAHETKTQALDDSGIRERIARELSAKEWAAPSLINVVVRNGIVDLWGSIPDERMRSAVIVAAENVPGVKAVRDHMAWVDPVSGFVQTWR